MFLVDSRPFTTGLAAATAGIVALSLVAAPPNAFDVAICRRVEVHAVQLAALTAADIRATLVNTAVKLASAATPASAPIPAAVSNQSPLAHAAASIQQAPGAATTPGPVVGFIENISVTIVAVVLGAVWYTAFPITLPLSYAVAVVLNKSAPNLTWVLALDLFLAAPLDVTSLIFSHLLSPSSSASTSVQPSSAPATASKVNAQTSAAAPISRTVAPKRTVPPKPLSVGVNGALVVGKPQVSRNEPSTHSGPLRTAVTSMTNNLSDTVKHAIGTISKKAQERALTP